MQTRILFNPQVLLVLLDAYVACKEKEWNGYPNKIYKAVADTASSAFKSLANGISYLAPKSVSEPVQNLAPHPKAPETYRRESMDRLKKFLISMNVDDPEHWIKLIDEINKEAEVSKLIFGEMSDYRKILLAYRSHIIRDLSLNTEDPKIRLSEKQKNVCLKYQEYINKLNDDRKKLNKRIKDDKELDYDARSVLIKERDNLIKKLISYNFKDAVLQAQKLHLIPEHDAVPITAQEEKEATYAIDKRLPAIFQPNYDCYIYQTFIKVNYPESLYAMKFGEFLNQKIILLNTELKKQKEARDSKERAVEETLKEYDDNLMGELFSPNSSAILELQAYDEKNKDELFSEDKKPEDNILKKPESSSPPKIYSLNSNLPIFQTGNQQTFPATDEEEKKENNETVIELNNKNKEQELENEKSTRSKKRR